MVNLLRTLVDRLMNLRITFRCVGGSSCGGLGDDLAWYRWRRDRRSGRGQRLEVHVHEWSESSLEPKTPPDLRSVAPSHHGVLVLVRYITRGTGRREDETPALTSRPLYLLLPFSK